MLRSKILKKKYLTLLTLATNTTLNAKINQVKNKICNITDLDTTAALTGIENKIPDHSKYITTPEFNQSATGNVTARLKQADLVSKGDIADYVKETDFNDKLKSLNNKKLPQINQNMYQLKMNLKNYKIEK